MFSPESSKNIPQLVQLKYVFTRNFKKHTLISPTEACFHPKVRKYTSVSPTEACFHPKV
jgi:hypothetical protein